MYAMLNRRDIKEFNRLDKRRKMKYDGKRNAEELRAKRSEVEAPEGRYESQLSRAYDGNPPSHR